MHSVKGFAVAGWLVAVAVVALGTFLFKPKAIDGESRRAKASASSTTRLEAANNALGAAVAASVAKIGEANAAAPESPAKDFIAREVPAALAKLPSPDPLELLAAEKRRAAVMEGRADEAARLYGLEAKRAAQLQTERDAALAARRAADSAILEAAAGRLAAEHQRNALCLIAGLCAALWLYSRAYGITPAAAGKILADVRAGVPAVAAFDTHLAPWMHPAVNKAARLATDPAA